MSTDSSVAGYLTPTTVPVYGDSLDNILQAAIVGLTGIAPDLCRPRWQPEPRTNPDFATDWVAFGVVRSTVDAFAYDRHDPTGEGTNTMERDEHLHVLHSFYGPNCHSLCEQFRYGLEVEQNRAVMREAGVSVVEVQDATILPALLKEKWVKRIDINVVYGRRAIQQYTVLSLTGLQATLDNELYTTSIIITP